MPPHPILKQLPTSSEPYAAAKRDVIARGILTNWEDLARKLRAISTPTPANAQPIQWKYSDSTRRRIRSNVASAKCHEQFSNCHRHALSEWLLALKRATLAGLPHGRYSCV